MSVHDDMQETELASAVHGSAAPDAGRTVPTASEQMVDVKVPADMGHRRLSPRAMTERYALLGAIAVVVIVFGIVEPATFLTGANAANVLGSQAVLVVLTLGMAVPAVSADYDLSVASVLALSSMLVAVLNVNHAVPIGLAVLAGIGCGGLIGAINGVLVVGLRIDALIVTLGTGTVATGVVLWISQSLTISGISPALVHAVIGIKVLGIPIEFVYGLTVCVGLWYFLQYTAAGRRLLFVGRGRSVARLSGVNVGRMRFGALMAAGLLSGLAGVLYAGTSGSADPSSGSALLLPAFAAVFLGSTSIIPGRFNAWGSFVAVYFLAAGITGLQLLGVQAFVQQIFYGCGLIGGVALRQVMRRRELRDAEG